MRILIAVAVVLLVAAIVGPQEFYAVDETQYVVVTRFGEVRGLQTTPGIRAKAPFIDAVTTLDKRLLRVDVPPSSFPDVEN